MKINTPIEKNKMKNTSKNEFHSPPETTAYISTNTRRTTTVSLRAASIERIRNNIRNEIKNRRILPPETTTHIFTYTHRTSSVPLRIMKPTRMTTTKEARRNTASWRTMKTNAITRAVTTTTAASNAFSSVTPNISSYTIASSTNAHIDKQTTTEKNEIVNPIGNSGDEEYDF